MLLALLLLQDPATIDRLITRLDADEFDAREAATRELIAIGEPAIEALRKAAQSSSPEVQVRAKRAIAEIEAEIRRREFPGGDPVAGFRAAIRIAREKPEFAANEKIEFEFEIRNVDSAACRLTAIRVIEAHVPGRADTFSMSHARIVIKQMSGTTRGWSGTTLSLGPKPDLEAVEIDPGKGAILTVGPAGIAAPIQRARSETLSPGEYEVHVVYFAESKGLIDGAEADLKSNVLRFTVTK